MGYHDTDPGTMAGLLRFIDEKYPEVLGTIKETGELSKDMEERFVQAIEKFKAEFVKNR